MARNEQRILVVEDDYFLAEDLRDALESRGLEVVGPVSNDADAMELLKDERIDSAILDINLAGTMVYPLARNLKSRGIPFVFLTGYEDVAQDSGVTDVELIRKPFNDRSLQTALDHLSRI